MRYKYTYQKKILVGKIYEHEKYTTDEFTSKFLKENDPVERKAMINNFLTDLELNKYMIHYLYAKVCLETGEFTCAEDELNKTVELKPSFYPALALKAVILSTDSYNRPKEALELAEQALAFNPYSAYVRYQYGLVLYANKKYNEANSQFKIASALSDNSQIYIAVNAIDTILTKNKNSIGYNKTKDDRSAHAGDACHDADVVNIQVSGNGSFEYEAPKGGIIESVCYHVTRENSLFPMSQHQVKKVNGEEFCQKVTGVGTNKVTISQYTSVGMCSTVKHMDVYLKKQK